MLNSDQLRVFLAVIRTGNTVAAAKRLGVDHSTVSRRLSALERALGARLFDRSPRGLAPTRVAEALVEHSERVERDLLAAASCIAGYDIAATGTVRLATPEVFGTWLVAPRLLELRERHPGLILELAPESRSVSLSRREADIAITLASPPRGRLVVRKLTDYSIGLYGARAYLEKHEAIGTPAALAGHMFTGYIDELLDYPEMNALETILPGAVSTFRSSSSAAQHAAVAAGVGLGMLHCLSADQDPRLQRVLPRAVKVRRSYWLVMHADQQQTPRIRAVVEFLRDAVDRMRDRLSQESA